MNELYVFAACDPNCIICVTNGAGKCDAGQCKPGFIYDTANFACHGNLTCVVYSNYYGKGLTEFIELSIKI